LGEQLNEYFYRAAGIVEGLTEFLPVSFHRSSPAFGSSAARCRWKIRTGRMYSIVIQLGRDSWFCDYSGTYCKLIFDVSRRRKADCDTWTHPLSL